MLEFLGSLHSEVQGVSIPYLLREEVNVEFKWTPLTYTRGLLFFIKLRIFLSFCFIIRISYSQFNNDNFIKKMHFKIRQKFDIEINFNFLATEMHEDYWHFNMTYAAYK